MHRAVINQPINWNWSWKVYDHNGVPWHFDRFRNAYEFARLNKITDSIKWKCN